MSTDLESTRAHFRAVCESVDAATRAVASRAAAYVRDRTLPGNFERLADAVKREVEARRRWDVAYAELQAAKARHAAQRPTPPLMGPAANTDPLPPLNSERGL